VEVDIYNYNYDLTSSPPPGYVSIYSNLRLPQLLFLVTPVNFVRLGVNRV